MHTLTFAHDSQSDCIKNIMLVMLDFSNEILLNFMLRKRIPRKSKKK